MAFLASVKFKDPKSVMRCHRQMVKWRPVVKIWVFPLFGSIVLQVGLGIFFFQKTIDKTCLVDEKMPREEFSKMSKLLSKQLKD